MANVFCTGSAKPSLIGIGFLPNGAIINFSSSVIGRVLPTHTGYAASTSGSGTP